MKGGNGMIRINKGTYVENLAAMACCGWAAPTSRN